jgi:hypothetical protein
MEVVHGQVGSGELLAGVRVKCLVGILDDSFTLVIIKILEETWMV